MEKSDHIVKPKITESKTTLFSSTPIKIKFTNHSICSHERIEVEVMPVRDVLCCRNKRF